MPPLHLRFTSRSAKTCLRRIITSPRQLIILTAQQYSDSMNPLRWCNWLRDWQATWNRQRLCINDTTKVVEITTYKDDPLPPLFHLYKVCSIKSTTIITYKFKQLQKNKVTTSNWTCHLHAENVLMNNNVKKDTLVITIFFFSNWGCAKKI